VEEAVAYVTKDTIDEQGSKRDAEHLGKVGEGFKEERAGI